MSTGGGGGVKQPVARVPCVSGPLRLDPLDRPAGPFPASLRQDSGSHVLGFGESRGTVSGLRGAKPPGSQGAIDLLGSQAATEPGSQQSRDPGTDSADSSEGSDNLQSQGPKEILRSFKSLNL